MKLKYIEIVVISLGSYMLVNEIFFENEKISDNTNKKYKKVQSDSKKK